MPQLRTATDGSLIDPRPKFTVEGDRVWLCGQRSHTILQWILAGLTSPLFIFRVMRLAYTDEWSRNHFHPDPTVIVPTGSLHHTDLVDHRPPGLDDKEAEETREREAIVAENQLRYAAEAPKSRSERLRQIDRRPRFTQDGRRIFLMQQRDTTLYETILGFVAWPMSFIWYLWKFRQEFARMDRETAGKSFDLMNFDELTFIIPTGVELFKEGGLVHYEDLDEKAQSTRGMGRKRITSNHAEKEQQV